MKFRKKGSIIKTAYDDYGVEYEFKFDLVDFIPRSGTSVCSFCSYNGRCHKFPDPEVSNRHYSFEDFCCRVGEGEFIPIPAEDSIEEAGLREKET